MKTTRKLLALVLTLTLVLSMATTAFAAGTIKVEGTSENEYTVYKFLNKETVDGGIVYKLASGWNDFATYEKNGVKVISYVTFTNGYASWINGATDPVTVASLAKLAKEYINEKNGDSVTTNDIASSGKIYAAADGTAGKDNSVNVTDDGYYVLVSNAGHSGIVLVNGNTKTVKDKNPDGGGVGGGDDHGLPNVKKEVQEDSDSSWGEANTADIGQTITFKTTITVGKGGTNYVLHDTMDSHLTFIGISSVKDQNGTDVPYTLVNPITDGHTFDISFSNDYLATLDDNNQIIVTYTAYINDTAAAGTGYVNETWLTHGENLDTTHDTTTSKTFSITVVKQGHNSVALEGAEFALKNADGKYYQLKDGAVNWVEKLVDATKYESKKDTAGNAVLVFNGLDAAKDYQLVETKAPAGYVLAANIDAISITVGNESRTITNELGNTLPETGGMGTTLFYTVGGIMVLAAVVLLITKKRMAVK